ncbi:hypothetical protein KNP414_06769 [Paenibacillus mucilaginosus KNP414]|uniref:Uncharacterized protein n=1 Tax=Paenibacillus mucilaginosus (strain KNP414) TaxID=1036673 RepID=F8FCG9_PAEMK|nr:hypothetical protein KNP414_06769 [Paenibacillus mucilaginosus KNP414]
MLPKPEHDPYRWRADCKNLLWASAGDSAAEGRRMAESNDGRGPGSIRNMKL